MEYRHFIGPVGKTWRSNNTDSSWLGLGTATVASSPPCPAKDGPTHATDRPSACPLPQDPSEESSISWSGIIHTQVCVCVITVFNITKGTFVYRALLLSSVSSFFSSNEEDLC